MKETVVEGNQRNVDPNGNIPLPANPGSGPTNEAMEVLKDVSNVNKPVSNKRRNSEPGRMRESKRGQLSDSDKGVQLGDGIQMAKTNIRYMSLVLNELQSYLDKLGQNLSDVTQKLLQRADGDAELEVYVASLLEDISEEHEKETQRIYDKMNEFKVYSRHAKTVISEIGNINSPQDKPNLECNVDNMMARLREIEQNLPECPAERYIYLLTSPAEGDNQNDVSPQARLGAFDKVSVPWRIEVRRIGTFRPDDVAGARVVTTVCPVSDDEGWVIWTWGPQLHLINKDGKVKRSISVGCKVDDVCLDFDGNLVVSCHEKRCIKILDANFKVQRTIDVEKIPRGISWASSNEMVVCSTENLHHRNGDSSGILFVDTESDQVATDLLGKDDLLQPWRIAVNYNGDICVSDRNKGTVTIFDREGRQKALYSGPDMATRHAFSPHGICCDEYGQIFVVDYSNHTVHVLDPLGRFRGFLIMDTELEKLAIFMGTSSPFSIGIDTSGDLWVGNKYGFVTVLRYQT